MRACFGFQYEALQKEFVQSRRPVFQTFFLFVIAMICMICVFVLTESQRIDRIEIIAILSPLMFCTVCMLFLKKFAYTEMFAIISSAATYTVIFSFRQSKIESVEDINFGFFLGFFERVAAERLPLFKHKFLFTIIVSVTRMIFLRSDTGSGFFFRLSLILFGFLLDFSIERKDQQLFKQYSDSRDSLAKVVEFFKLHLFDSIMIVKQNLEKIVITNDSLRKMFDNKISNDVFKELFKQFKLEDMQMKKAASRLLASNTNKIMSEETSKYMVEMLSSDGTDQLSQLNDLNLYSILTGLQNKDLSGSNQVLFEYNFTYTPEEKTETRLLKIKAIPFLWDGENELALSIKDITDQLTLSKLQREDEEKDRLIATVSHELRTPLNGILGMIQVVEREIDQPHLFSHLKTCKNSALLLLSLVNSILDIGQLKNKKIKTNIEKIEIDEIVDQITSLFEHQCREKNIYLKVELNKSLPSFLRTDKNRLCQILINLLGNALKFTFQGGLTLSVKPGEIENEGVIFSVSDTGIGIKEEDYGQLFQVYGKLQTTAKLNKQGVGLGLSISDSLARLLNANAEDSGIKVKSEYEKGSTFSFQIKRDLEEAERRANEDLELQALRKSRRPNGDDKKKGNRDEMEKIFEYEDRDEQDDDCHSNQLPFNRLPSLLKAVKMDSRSSFGERSRTLNKSAGDASIDQSGCLSPKSVLLRRDRTLLNDQKMSGFYYAKLPWILIVDDNPFNLMVARELVEFHGFNVDTALNGKLALNCVEKKQKAGKKYKMILMDCEMPVMDGFEATKAILKKVKLGSIEEVKIVALTANNVDTVKERCLKVGMVDCLSKPLFEGDLKRVLQEHL